MNNLLCVNWEAIGAIGTAIGSIATAIAVIIAIIQLKQPTKKAITVFSASGFTVMNSVPGDNIIYVEIKNKGNRDIQLQNIYLMVGNKKVYLLPHPCNQVTLPQVLPTESMVTMYFPYEKVIAFLNEKIDKGEFELKATTRFMVVDGVGDNHYGNKINLKKFLGR